MSEGAPHDYSAFEEDRPPLGENSLASLRALVQTQLDLEARVAGLEEQLKEAQEALTEVQDRRLPALMEALEVEEHTFSGGLTVKIHTSIQGSLPKESKAEALQWLEAHGHAEIIKREITANFGRGEEDRAAELQRYLRERYPDFPVKMDRSVHPSTLKSFVRQQLSEGVALPMRAFGVYQRRAAKIKLPKPGR